MATNAAPLQRVSNFRSLSSLRAPVVSSGNDVSSFDSISCSGWYFQNSITCTRDAGYAMVVYEGSPESGVKVTPEEASHSSLRFVADLVSEKYTLSRMLAILVKESDGQFIASDPDPSHDWFGYGASEEEAVRRFMNRLVEDLEGLSAREARLSEQLHSELAQLRMLVVPRR